jgi:hypothetical protein
MFLNSLVFQGEVVGLKPTPISWRTMGLLFVWPLSRRGDTARSICLHEQSSLVVRTCKPPEEKLVKVIIPNESN